MVLDLSRIPEVDEREKRKSVRVNVRGEHVSGRMVLAADLDVQDISHSGVRFLSCERIVPQSKVSLVIFKDEVKFHVESTVVRSSLKGLEPGRCDGRPLYEVAASFDTVEDECLHSLEALLSLFRKD